MNETIADTILKGMNNPDCAFYVGKWLGGYESIRIVIVILILLLIYKAIDKLAFEPMLNWITNKFRGKNGKSK